MWIKLLQSGPLRDQAGDAGGSGGGGDSSAGDNSAGGSGDQSGDAGGGQGSESHSSDPVFRQILGDDGQFAEGWVDKLPGDFDPYKATLSNFRDFGGLSKALVDNMQAARAKTEGMVKLPADDASDEEKAAFRQALGIPEKPEDYGLKPPEKLPEGVEWDEGFASDFAGTAHQLGLTPQQVQGLAQWHQQRSIEQHQQFEQDGTKAFEQEQADLRQTFGDQFEKRMVDARRVAMTLGLDPDKHPIFYRADTVKALTKVADLISEDRLVSADQVTNSLTPETQAKDIMTNPNNPDYEAFNNPTDPRHSEVNARVDGLMKRAFPA